MSHHSYFAALLACTLWLFPVTGCHAPDDNTDDIRSESRGKEAELDTPAADRDLTPQESSDLSEDPTASDGEIGGPPWEGEVKPRSVVDMQRFRRASSMSIQNGKGSGRATLVNLNPGVGRWYLLSLEWEPAGTTRIYHLENPAPERQQIVLDTRYPNGVVIRRGKERDECPLWAASGPFSGSGSGTGAPYLSLCRGKIYLRNRVEGHRTTLEWATDSLRDYVWGGEQITVFVRNSFYKDAFLSTSEVVEGTSGQLPRTRPEGAPAPAQVAEEYRGDLITPSDLGIELEDSSDGKVMVGRWYRARKIPGVFLSSIQPMLVSREVIDQQKDSVPALDEVESKAMVILIGFDLDDFEFGFAMGTEHPRVDWSERVLPEMYDPNLPGPDGFATVEPLINTGMLSPLDSRRAVATFTGGFKRYHGVFRRGSLATSNHGSHYGFMEFGVVMSQLQPGLATAIVRRDDRVELKTWSEEDEARLSEIKHARQNGVPILEYDPAVSAGRPSRFIKQSSLGNWSGSVEGRYRTLRAGICTQESGDRQFLLYGYFSSATAAAMARVFQAYGCRYAMLTDMNALEHTYLAVYRREESELYVQHLIRGMEVLDKSSQGRVVARFLNYADNRDFFYLLRRKSE